MGFGIRLSTILLSVVLSAASLQAQENTKRSSWPRSRAADIELSQETRIPLLSSVTPLSENIWAWDSWVLRHPDGSQAKVHGHYLLFSLTAGRSLAPEDRHNNARIGYWISNNGKDWTFKGPVFKETESLGSRQWSGSAVYKNGKVYLFYTAVGQKNDPWVSMEQRLALAKGSLVEDGDGVSLKDWSPHQVILEAEGTYYQTDAQSVFDPEHPDRRTAAPGPEGARDDGGSDIIYSFRDPWYFEDPETGKSMLLFAANTPGVSHDKRCQKASLGDADAAINKGIPRGAVQYNGSVGLAIAPDPNNLFVWERKPAILNAECVNQQLEIPRFVFKDGKYYLFAASHTFTFANALKPVGLDALYGFVADDLTGNYEPLNGSGLVLGNPEEDPIQTFAWVVLKDGLVISYVNYYNLEGLSPGDIYDQPVDYLRQHFGGTLAPTIALDIEGKKTTIRRVLGPGQIVE
jgi:levansucrase